MPTPPIPLSTLAANAVPYEWHDAVAIVAQIVEQLRADLSLGEKRVPELNAITLEQNGAITFESNARQSTPAMPGAALLLQQLLGGREQPAHLRLLAMQAAIADPPPTLEAFAADLAGWERPNRQAKLAALYTSVRAAQESPQPPLHQSPIAAAAPPAIESRPEAPPPFAGIVGDETDSRGAESAGLDAPRRTPVSQPQPGVDAKVANPKATARHGSRQRSNLATLTTRELAVLGACGALVIGSAAWIATGQPIPFVSRGSAANTTSSTTNASPGAAPAQPGPAQGSEIARADTAAAPPTENQPAASVEAPAATRASATAPAATRPTQGPPARAERAPEPAGRTRETPSSVSRTQAAAAPRTQAPAAAGPTAGRGASSPSPAARPSSPSGSSPAMSQSPATSRPGQQGTPSRGSAPGVSAQPGAAPAPSAAAPQASVAPDQAWYGVRPAEPSGREYRSGDPGVVEPVPLARLPRKPDPSTPRDRLQVLEVHVNTDGTVESARFVVRPPTYRNRWWVSAAKSWRFRPALKDGKPVRFVMQIPFDEAGGL